MNSRRLREIGTYLLLAAGAVFGIVIGVLFALSNPRSGPQPTATIPVPAGSQQTATPAPLWYVTFTAPVAGGPWSEGTHDYVLSLSCQDGSQGTWPGTFFVSSQFERRNERVYLRTGGGLLSAETGGDPVRAVNPAQPLGAAMTLAYPTLEGAEAARVGCQAYVQVDQLTAQRLDPRIPVQH